jgi:mannose-6-phosphate isomerase-like protein (cupin superfamily)
MRTRPPDQRRQACIRHSTRILLLVASTEAPDVVEMWDWTLGPRETYVSEKHSAGTRELLHVLTGSVMLTVADESVALGAGDAVGFGGNRPHTYANDGNRTALSSLSVYQPGAAAQQRLRLARLSAGNAGADDRR